MFINITKNLVEIRRTPIGDGNYSRNTDTDKSKYSRNKKNPDRGRKQ